MNKTVSPAKQLFLGKIVEDNLIPFPRINSETTKIIVQAVSDFMKKNESEFRKHDEEAKQPEEYISDLKEQGLFGLIIPEEYGGLGLSNSEYSRVLQESSKFDASTSLTIGAHSSIGMKGILLFGTPEQKTRYLPRLASGELIAAFCLTEPGAGSDAGSVKTTATKKEDGSWSLSGEKIWISNGAFAGLFTVFARTSSAHGKMSAFIVERCFSGVSTGPKEDKLGIRASATTSVAFDNVHVPAENLLGEEGTGFKLAMEILNNGRTGLGGGCVGGMKKAINLSTQQAISRKQFGKSISEFGLIQEKLSQMTVQCFASESVVSMVAHYIDSGVSDFSTEAAISKIFATESLWFCANEALQIAGGNGYMKDYPYERLLRDTRINMIFEGTNEILRLYVALSGLKDAGTYLKGISKSVQNMFNDPIKGFGVLRDYAEKKMAQVSPVGRERLDKVCKELESEAGVISAYTAEFARVVESVLKEYRDGVIEEQIILKHLTDVAIDLFVSLCVISRVSSWHQSGGDGQKDFLTVLSIAQIFVAQAKRRMNQNLRRVTKNENVGVRFLAKQIITNGGYSWDTF